MILKYVNNKNEFNNIKQVAKVHFHMSDRLIVKLKNKQLIILNGILAKITDKIKLNDIVEFNLNYEEVTDNILPTKMILDIIYEDDSLLIVNKPPVVPVHPSANHFDDSLSNGVKYYFDSIGLNKKIRPVNRLDKNTSGLVIFAKNEYIQEELIFQMKTNSFKKRYLALLNGKLHCKKGIINAPISRKEGSIIEREVNFETGQKAITNYNVIKDFSKNSFNYSLTEFELITGRTHQIRVHSKYIGHPILGDSLYGSESKLISRQALHSYYLEFNHPISKERLIFEIDLPKDIKELL